MLGQAFALQPQNPQSPRTATATARCQAAKVLPLFSARVRKHAGLPIWAKPFPLKELHAPLCLVQGVVVADGVLLPA
ncbi:MAG: hypothetical protein CL450_09025 [Acidimicrobiaceae bacterium]|nr:hypothetical protein [Acidimicrobiaceae bacterium]|tara:strand:+ start:2807 stop:3037 length:231 start_codon:yes stop_codon:yes gene_type:complete